MAIETVGAARGARAGSEGEPRRTEGGRAEGEGEGKTKTTEDGQRSLGSGSSRQHPASLAVLQPLAETADARRADLPRSDGSPRGIC